MEMKEMSNENLKIIIGLKRHFRKKYRTPLMDAEDTSADIAPASEDVESIVADVVSTMDSVEFMPVFDYNEWLQSKGKSSSADNFLMNTELLKTADLETLRKIMTAHSRIGRFAGGHMEKLVENGYIEAMLNRIEELSKE